MIEMLYISHNGPASLQGSVSDVDGILAKALMPAPQQDITFTREDHMLKELSLIRSAMRSPRRSQTHQDYKIPAGPLQPPTGTATHAAARGPPQEREAGQSDKSNSGSAERPSERPAEEQPRPSEEQAPRRRPPLGPPRRSYSVMDYEPLPHHHRPSSRLTLMDLPGELHMAIFDFLDPIDSTCFGLANKHFYAIHRRMHGSVPLSARRDGPNELEWAWHLAGTLIKAPPSVSSPAATTNVLGHHEHNALAKLRVRGQAYCRKCGITRCELYKHIKDWMGEGMEYCEVKQKFGPAAPEGARSFCYMSVPNNPHRCGRHRAQKTQIVTH